MAKLGDITIRTAEYRPCYVTEAIAYSDGRPVVRHERKALFHRWAEIIEPPKWGESIRAAAQTVAIVEFEDGNVAEVEPSAVRFVPGLMNEYDFMEAVNETRDGVD